ncbi:hypothetical protein V491_09376 [Pseudogymnoascus sp. VKM F-3775]|nr:hypothetical protein V491_09376 [Pseudogymnoascus sp. VKM F-3775]
MLRLAVFTAFAALGSAMAIDTEAVNIVERSGDHYANVYGGQYCSGDVLAAVPEFGCGGQCHKITNGVSILLGQSGTGNPKPTASYFSDSNCQHQIGSAGIYAGEHTGCTNSGQFFNSFYLYFNC